MPIDIADVAEVIFYTEDSTSPLTVVKPAAFGPGQLLVYVITQHAVGGGLSSLTGPAGWIDEGNYNDTGGDSAGRVWSHVYNAADPSTWDFPYQASADVASALIRITGADTTPIILVTSHAGAQVSGTVDSPTITPTGINDLLIVTLSALCNGSAFTETDPTGTTNYGQAQIPGDFMAIAVAGQQLTDGNATGAKAWTAVSPATSAGGTFSIAIKSSGFLDPDPPPNPPPPLVPPWLLRELVGKRQQPVRGDQYTPVVKEKLSGGASGANVTLTTSATTVAGDVLVAFHGNNFYTAAQLLTPTGTAGTWTQQALGDNGTDSAHMKIWTRKVTVDGAQTVTLAPAVDEEHSVFLLVVSGADPTTWVDVAAGGNGGSGTAHIAPSVDPTVQNALLLVGAQSTSLGNYTIPTTLGMQKLSEVDVGGFCTSAAGAEVLGNDSPTGTRMFTITAAGAFATASIALKPVQDVVVAGGGSRTADDTAAATDTVTTTAAFTRTLADTASAADTVTAARAQFRTGTDTAAASDTPARALTLPRTFTDAAAAEDALARVVAQARTPADSAPASDAVARTTVLARALTDSAPATDTASGVVTPAGGGSRTATDSAPASDSVTRTSTRARSISDSAPGVDSLARTTARPRALADAVPAVDALARSVVLARSIGDTAATADTITRTTTRARSLSDAASISDSATGSVSPAGGAQRTATDAAPATDAVTRAPYTRARSIADSAPGSDTASKAVARFRTATDTAAATDTVAKQFIRARAAADTASASDDATARVVLIRVIADSAPAVDDLAVLLGVLTTRGSMTSAARTGPGMQPTDRQGPQMTSLTRTVATMR